MSEAFSFRPRVRLQYYQQARLRGNDGYTEKLRLNFSGGIEIREFEGGESTKVNPVFSPGVSDQPFDGTYLSLVGYRNVVGSNAQASQDYIATGVVIAAQQRLFQNLLPK